MNSAPKPLASNWRSVVTRPEMPGEISKHVPVLAAACKRAISDYAALRGVQFPDDAMFDVCAFLALVGLAQGLLCRITDDPIGLSTFLLNAFKDEARG